MQEGFQVSYNHYLYASLYFPELKWLYACYIEVMLLYFDLFKK